MQPGARQRGFLLLAALIAVLPAAGAHAAPRSAGLTVSGLGGQTALLVAPRGGLDVVYPVFTEPRVPGPDGAVGGLAIQRAGDGRLVGGEVLLNATGFDRAVSVPLVDFEHTVLPAGRYRLTLLGTGHRVVHLVLRRTTHSRHLSGQGPARPITRVLAATAPLASSWSDPVGRISARDYLIAGAGVAGDNQQASEVDLCVSPQAAASAPCLTGGSQTITPGEGGAGTWSGELFGPGVLKPGSYVFSGDAVGVGPSSRTGRVAIVISPRR